jgi:DNA-binding beta-propeller fold protein YncE
MTLLGAGTAQAQATGFGVIATIGVQLDPDAVAVDSSSGTVYVANAGNGSVAVISSNAGTPATVSRYISVGADPDAVAVDPTTGNVYVANGTYAGCGPPGSAPGCDDSVSVIDMSSLGPVTDTISLPAGDNPDAVAADPSTGNVYVVSDNNNNPDEDGAVSVMNEYTNTVTGNSIPVGPDPVAVAVDPSTGNVYVANANADNGDGTVSVINEHTDAVATIRGFVDPDAVAVDPVTGHVYIADGDGFVYVIDGIAFAGYINIGWALTGVAVDPVTHNVYVTNQQLPDSYNGFVEGINVQTDTLTAPIPLEPGTQADMVPDAVAVDPNTGNVYVTNADGPPGDDNTVNGTVSVVGPEVSPTITGTPDTATVGTPYYFPFGVTGSPTPNVTWAAPEAGEELPPGMNMSPSGTLYGTPTTPGTYTFEVIASSSFPPAGSETVTVTVLPAPPPPPPCHQHFCVPPPPCHQHFCV